MTKCAWSEHEMERQEQIHFVVWTSINEELIQFPSKYKKCHALLAQTNCLHYLVLFPVVAVGNVV